MQFKNKYSTKRYFESLLFIFPMILMLVVFIYIPLIQNFYYSTLDFSSFAPKKTFVGFENYITLFKDKVLYIALSNNFKYAVISVIFQVGFGLILAAILEDIAFKKIAPLYRTIYFLPVVISSSVVCLLFTFIYHPSKGLLNGFLQLLGMGALTQPWLGQPSTALYATAAVSQWHSIGYIMMLIIVAIQKIPEDLYEAAKIDGAGKIKSFFNITIPQIKETLFVTTIITITGSVMVFNEPYIMTKGGGPGTSSITIAIHMYQSGFFKDKMGYASTIAIVIFTISVVLGLIQTFAFGTGKEE